MALANKGLNPLDLPVNMKRLSFFNPQQKVFDFHFGVEAVAGSARLFIHVCVSHLPYYRRGVVMNAAPPNAAAAVRKIFLLPPPRWVMGAQRRPPVTGGRGGGGPFRI